jgi:hypothetical protein
VFTCNQQGIFFGDYDRVDKRTLEKIVGKLLHVRHVKLSALSIGPVDFYLRGIHSDKFISEHAGCL